MIPFIDNASVSVCATVNIVTCHNSGFIRVLSRKIPRINRIWSVPFGTMCSKPITTYEMITSVIGLR